LHSYDAGLGAIREDAAIRYPDSDAYRPPLRRR
jgi:hypothetical protein